LVRRRGTGAGDHPRVSGEHGYHEVKSIHCDGIIPA